MTASEERAITGEWYRLIVREGAPIAWLDDHEGRHWAQLRLLASIDTLDGPDETLDIAGPTVAETGGLPAAHGHCAAVAGGRSGW